MLLLAIIRQQTNNSLSSIILWIAVKVSWLPPGHPRLTCSSLNIPRTLCVHFYCERKQNRHVCAEYASNRSVVIEHIGRQKTGTLSWKWRKQSICRWMCLLCTGNIWTRKCWICLYGSYVYVRMPMNSWWFVVNFSVKSILLRGK